MDYVITVTIADNGVGEAGKATSQTQQLSIHGFGPIDSRGLILAQLDKMAASVVNKHIPAALDG